jgi:small subunit ribosomal protein S7
MPRKLITKKRFFSNHKEACVYELIRSQIIKNGCKSVATNILDSCFTLIEEKLGIDPFLVVETALSNIMPEVTVVKAAERMNVVLLNTFQSLKFAVKLLVKNARERKERTFKTKLMLEVLDAYSNRGVSIKCKNDLYAQAKHIQTYESYDSEDDEPDFFQEYYGAFSKV